MRQLVLPVFDLTSARTKQLSVRVKPDSITELISKKFDYAFSGVSSFALWRKPAVPKQFGIGVIVGASGTGKSLLLSEFGQEETIKWDTDRSIVSHFASDEEAYERLMAVGFGSVPSWFRPYHCLSTGEKFRADMSRKIKDGAVIDEFTSVVDRNVAKATSVAIAKYVKTKRFKNIVFASCHEDILDWLCPDWVFDTNEGKMFHGRFLQRPKIVIDLYEGSKTVWPLFEKHHYLTSKLHVAARCFLAFWNGRIVGFASAISKGFTVNAFREHRTVVLPDFQGMGIGTRLSEAVAEIFLSEGKRYYSRTANVRMGMHRNKSPLWRNIYAVPVDRSSDLNKWQADVSKRHVRTNRGAFIHYFASDRAGYSHEYIGARDNVVGKEQTGG